MGLSAPGVGSNLDVNSLVSQLMAIERQPLALVQKREAAVQAQLSAFGMLQSQIASFGDASSALAKAGALAAFKASVGDTEVASASVSGATAAGSYSLEVKQLAHQTVKATSEISAQIELIQEQTQAAVEAVNQIDKIIQQLNNARSAGSAAQDTAAAD